MAQNTPSFVQNPTWQSVRVQTVDQFGEVSPQSVDLLPQNQFNLYLRSIQNAIQSVTGSGGNQANIQGPLSLNSNPITGVTNSSPPASDEALSYGTAQSLYSTLRQALKVVYSNYAIQPADGTILVDATAGPVTLTLPQAKSAPEYIFIVMKVDATANAVMLAALAGETVSGPVTFVSSQWGKLWPQSDAKTGWWIVNS